MESSIWPDKMLNLEYFKGRGPMPIGCVDLMLSQDLFLRLYYPTEPGAATEPREWYPRREYRTGFMEAFGITPLLEPINHGLCTARSKMCVAWGGPLGALPAQLRPIVLSPGWMGFRGSYSILAADLASQGFLVAAIEHRDGSACWSYDVERGEDGALRETPLPFSLHRAKMSNFELAHEALGIRVSEVRRTLDLLQGFNERGARAFAARPVLGQEFDWDSFKGRLSLGAGGVVGHSFGGATALTALLEDPRLVFGIGLDSWLFPLARDLFKNPQRLTKPFFFLNATDFRWPENLRAQRRFLVNPLVNMLFLPGCDHVSAHDSTIFYNSDWLAKLVGYVTGARTRRHPVSQFALMNRLMMSFIGQSSEGGPSEKFRDIIASAKADVKSLGACRAATLGPESCEAAVDTHNWTLLPYPRKIQSKERWDILFKAWPIFQFPTLADAVLVLRPILGVAVIDD